MAELFAGDGTPNREALAGLRPSQVLAEQERLADELAEAKAGGDPDRLKAAKVAVDRFRTYQRSLRPEPSDGEARPDAVNVTTQAQEG